MSKGNYPLIVVAHPDDETLYFAGLMLSQSEHPWHVICVTDGNADGMGTERNKQFLLACKELGVSCEHWNFPDVYDQRLDVDELEERLRQLEMPRVVYTHCIIGEYGHPHHQDVSYATHKAFSKDISVNGVAYNCYPDQWVQLSPKDFAKKSHLLADVYKSETRRFANILPSTAYEVFCQFKNSEIEALYRFFISGEIPDLQTLEKYRWYWSHLQDWGNGIPPRMF